MKEIAKYKSEDGEEFIIKRECLQHEANCQEIYSIMQQLPERFTDNDCSYANGMGYIQHERENILKVRNQVLEFFKRYTDHKWIQETIDKGFEADSSWAGRVIEEVAPRTIYKHWYRFGCIDSDIREWGQPYYANNTPKGENFFEIKTD